MKIEILYEAEKDIVNGISFYESQKENLGNYFLDSIFSDIESLHIYAGIHTQIAGFIDFYQKDSHFLYTIKLKIKQSISMQF